MARRKFGWHTPDEYEEADILCRPLFVPLPFVHIVGGALAELTHKWNWEHVGSMTPERATEIMAAMLRQWYEEGCLDCQDVMTCLAEANQYTRYNPTTGAMERSFDGGETWQDATDTDPRFVGPRLGPIASNCDEVNSIVRMVQEAIDQTLAEISAGTSIAQAAAVLLGLLAAALTF